MTNHAQALLPYGYSGVHSFVGPAASANTSALAAMQGLKVAVERSRRFLRSVTLLAWLFLGYDYKLVGKAAPCCLRDSTLGKR